MAMLKKDEINVLLEKYYTEYYGAKDTDLWCEQAAVNVWTFCREGKYISLQCHILTGEITVHIE